MVGDPVRDAADGRAEVVVGLGLVPLDVVDAKDDVTDAAHGVGEVQGHQGGSVIRDPGHDAARCGDRHKVRPLSVATSAEAGDVQRRWWNGRRAG